MYYPELFENPDHFLTAIDILIEDHSEEMVVPFAHFTSLLTTGQLKHFLNRNYAEPPSSMDAVREVWSQKRSDHSFGGEIQSTLDFLTTVVKHTARKGIHGFATGKMAELMGAFVIRRPTVTLDTREQETFRGMGRLFLLQELSIVEWKDFVARLAWGEGNYAHLEPDSSVAHHPKISDAYALAQLLLKQTLSPYQAVIAQAGRRVVAASKRLAVPVDPPSPAPTAAPLLTAPSHEPFTAPRLMTPADLASAASLSLEWTPASLTLGFTDDASHRPVFFNGNESLITAGGPGSYKTTSQVIRNLLTYPGSAIVLDVKGELWEQTAGHRAANFGEVYKFAPAAKDQRSHCYNPFDFISNDPAQATADCDAFGYEIISDNPDTRDPYWENRARNYLWAFATMLAISAPQSLRNMAHLAQCLNINTNGTKKKGKVTLAASTEAALQMMSALGDKHGIHDLCSISDAIRSGIGLSSNRAESIFDIARNHVTPFSQRSFVQNVTRSSDWHPLAFRYRPGTTLYLHVPTSELPSFTPLLRLMIYQHMRILLDHAAEAGEPPITFFLDELPQLGNFKSILQMQAVGRGAGLRLWMFVQNLRQLHTAYGLEAGRAIPEDARVRCYMKPDEGLAEHISRTLGKTENLFTGERRPIASAAEIRGPKFRNKTFVFASEDYPVVLERRPAFQDLGYLIQDPPEVPLVSGGTPLPRLPSGEADGSETEGDSA